MMPLEVNDHLKKSNGQFSNTHDRNQSPGSAAWAQHHMIKPSENLISSRNYGKLKQGLNHPEQGKPNLILQNALFMGLGLKPSYATGSDKENFGIVKTHHMRAQSSCLSEFMDFAGQPSLNHQPSSSKGVRVRDLFPK